MADIKQEEKEPQQQQEQEDRFTVKEIESLYTLVSNKEEGEKLQKAHTISLGCIFLMVISLMCSLGKFLYENNWMYHIQTVSLSIALIILIFTTFMYTKHAIWPLLLTAIVLFSIMPRYMCSECYLRKKTYFMIFEWISHLCMFGFIIHYHWNLNVDSKMILTD